jgi:DNA ligase-1
LQVGGALLWRVVQRLTQASDDQIATVYRRYGDLGAAVHDVLSDSGASDRPGVTLVEAEHAFREIAAATGPAAKGAVVERLVARATPLEAKYLVKIITGEMRIGLRESLVEEAITQAYGVELKAVQRANMLLGDVAETLRLAAANRLADARMRLFHPIGFMLASPAETATEAFEYIEHATVEDKYDGIRAQVHKQAGRVALFSRTLDEVTHRFPELIEPLRSLPGEFILDGEVLAARGTQILPFKELQQRLGRKDVSAELLAATPVIFVAYDILYQDGEVLLGMPLAERRRRLDVLPFTEPLRTSLLIVVDDVDQIDPLFEAARGRGNEGLMIKDPASAYKPGRRGREWLKVKKAFATLDVVVTAAEVGTGNRRRFLSDYTFAVRRSRENGELLNVGKAYSGLTDAEVAALTDWFKAHTLKDFGRVKLVEPKIVLEVAFDTVQPSARHKSGYALRFPRIVRWRTDKPIDEIDTLETVRALAGSPLEGDLEDRVAFRTGSSTIEELET